MESPTSPSSTAAATGPAATTAVAASTSAADPPSPRSQSLSRSSAPDPTNPSPSPTSSPPPPDSAVPTPNTAPPSSSAHRRVPPPCWSTEETIALIDAYQNKWYSLRRGNLRANDWQDVADAVTARGPRRLATPENPQSFSAAATAPKTAVQCRHKVEKLRKRYRAEKQRALKRNPRVPPKSSWEFFRKMHAMESGGPPAHHHGASRSGGAGGGGSHSRTRPASAQRSQSPRQSSPDNSDNDEEEDVGNHQHRHTRPINGSRHAAPAIPQQQSGFRFNVPKASRTKPVVMTSRHQGSTTSNSPFGGIPRHQQQHLMPAHWQQDLSCRVEEDRRHKKQRLLQQQQRGDGGADGGGGMGEVAEAVRMLGDGFMRMEQMKMDMAMQIHRLRMETEMKRTQMMIESNQKILDLMIGGGGGGSSRE